MKILVTGSSGKIGIKVTKYLIKNKIFCYGNSRRKLKIKSSEKYFKNYNGDLLSKLFCLPEDIDVFCHLAFETDYYFKKVSLKRALRINKKIFNLVRKHKNIKKFIFISSASVYSSKNLGLVNEKIKYLDSSIYSISKFKSEKMFLKLKNIKVYNLRIPAVLSTGKENNFICNTIEKIKKNKPITIYNPKNFFNNIILVKDLSNFILKLIRGNFKRGTILLGSKQPIKNKFMIRKLIDYFRSKSIVTWQYKKEGFYLSLSKAIRLYKFKPKGTMSGIYEYLKFKY